MSLRDAIAELRSGGQTGVDIGCVRVARWFGVKTAGWMPLGWRTLAGPRPEYATLYGMKEASSREYAPRTFANAAEADTTIRIAARFDSPGEICTMRACLAAGYKPYDVLWVPGTREPAYEYLSGAVDHVWRERHRLGRPIRLNCAGNAEQTVLGIERAAMIFTYRLLAWLDSDVPACMTCGHVAALHSTGLCGRGETKCRCAAYVPTMEDV